MSPETLDFDPFFIFISNLLSKNWPTVADYYSVVNLVGLHLVLPLELDQIFLSLSLADSNRRLAFSLPLSTLENSKVFHLDIPDG